MRGTKEAIELVESYIEMLKEDAKKYEEAQGRFSHLYKGMVEGSIERERTADAMRVMRNRCKGVEINLATLRGCLAVLRSAFKKSNKVAKSKVLRSYKEGWK